MTPSFATVPPRPSRPLWLALLWGVGLALACALLGPLLTPPALARYTLHLMEDDRPRALLGLIGVRHLPVFLLAFAWGLAALAWLGRTSARTVLALALPYWVYAVVQGVMDSLQAGERAFEWVFYEPAYFIWPHFLTVPMGLAAAAHRLARRAPAHS
jgi:hypothetical protein